MKIDGKDSLPFRKNDIFIVSYPRSGTTWLQQMVYQIISGCSMHFQHISQVCPWYERAIKKREVYEPIFGKMPSPRIVKTHLPYAYHPRPDCKYIYIQRDGKDVAMSYYHFYCKYFNYTEEFSSFFDQKFIKGDVQYGLWFSHVADWKKNVDNLNILYLTYEDLKDNIGRYLSRISDFCNLSLPESSYIDVINNSSFDYMRSQYKKFDHYGEILWEMEIENRGVRNVKIQKYLESKLTASKDSFVRSGAQGEGTVALTDKQNQLFDEYRNVYMV